MSVIGTSERVCPACRGALVDRSCTGCGRSFPDVAGLPDLRIASDRFLDLPGERAKAERLAGIATGVDLKGLAEAYYAMTPDVEPRRRGFYLGHILGAEARGSALAALLPRSGRILEVGCGTGGLLASAARIGLDIEGVDIALRWLVVARRRLDDRGLSVPMVAASADRLPYADASFDCIVADSLLEHLDDPASTVEEWARVLRPGGALLVWSPNRYAMTVDPHVRLWGLGWLPRNWMPAYVRWRRGGAWPPPCLSTGEARRMAIGAGFESIEVEPPSIPDDWASSRPGSQRVLIAAYALARGVPGFRSILRAFRAALAAPGDPAGGGMIRIDRATPNVPLFQSRSFRHALLSPHSLAVLIAAELFASMVGFGVMIHLARRLGPSSFADFEYASAVAAWWLVVVRGGFDTIVYREAARRPGLVRPLTDVLIGLRGASATLAMAAVMGLAWTMGPGRGWVVATAGLVLIPSALASDVGLRASGRFGGLAMAQAIRAVGLAVGVGSLVAGPGDVAVAAGCVVGAEVASTVVLLAIHGSEHGRVRPRYRRLAWASLACRGMIAGATRFGRVSLYAADLLILGMLASPGLGPYAAARRVAFALLSLGLVVPSAVAPWISRAWASGPAEAREVIGRTFEGLFAVALPATVGLMLTADRWMPRLFGEGFREGGPWLALIAARLPFVLASNVQQAALISCRREDWAFRLMAGMVAMAVVMIPPVAFSQGPWGVGAAVLGIEIVGSFCGWIGLRRLGVAPVWHHASGPALAGCVGMALVCSMGRDWPLAGVVIIGAGVYGVMFLILGRPLHLGVGRKIGPRAEANRSPIISGGPAS